MPGLRPDGAAASLMPCLAGPQPLLHYVYSNYDLMSYAHHPTPSPCTY